MHPSNRPHFEHHVDDTLRGWHAMGLRPKLACLCLCTCITGAVSVPAPPSLRPRGGWNASAAMFEYVNGLHLPSKYCTSPTVHWDVGHQHVLAECAAVQAQLWVLGGATSSTLANGAVGNLMALATQVNATKEADFFTCHPMMLAYTLLQPAGKLSVEQAAAVRAFVAKTFRTQTPASNNQHYQRAAGLALAAQTFPTLPLAKKWLTYSQAVWTLVVMCGDITEDAPNYNRIDLTFLWVLGDLLGKTKQLSSPLFRVGMFSRFAAQVSPLGIIPSYGDSGGSRPVTAANFSDNPWSNPCWGFVAGFIRAAAEFNDDGLAATSRALFEGGVATQALGGAYSDVAAAYRLLFGVRWGLLAPAPAVAVPAVGSAVLTRRDKNGPHVPDKIVLRSGGSPYASPASFLLSDLYGTEIPVPPHAHENQHGQVNYFEHAQIPLVSSLGYDNRGPADTNLLLVRPMVSGSAAGNASFPHRVPDFAPHTWEHTVLPTKRIGTGDLHSDPVSISEITLRIEWDGKPIVFSAAAMALKGPSGTRQLELFKRCSMWKQGRNVNCTQTTETLSDGSNVPALEWAFPGGKAGQEGAQFISLVHPPNVLFDAAVFPELHVDWRFSRTFQDTRSFILRVQSSPNSVDFHAAVLNLAPALTDASVETAVAVSANRAYAGNDSLATMRYSNWFSFDIELNRSILLAGSEGVLLVRDTISVGASAATESHFRAGPIWHFGPVAQPIISLSDKQPWVMSQNASVNLCVIFASMSPSMGPAGDLHVGVQTAAVWQKDHQRTAFASRLLHEAGTYTFISLLVPVHASDVDKSSLRSFDAAIDEKSSSALVATVTWAKDRCHGSGQWCGTKLKMTLPRDDSADTWSVTRTLYGD